MAQPKRSFDLPNGKRIGRHYETIEFLGSGSEGEAYRIFDLETGIERAAKLYFPHKNPKNRNLIWAANKLNRLRDCPIVLKYHHRESVRIRRDEVICMISELCDGSPLEAWVSRQPSGRLSYYTALHLFYRLLIGLETIHNLGEYHGDVHPDNILVRATGVSFDLKLIDFYNHGRVGKRRQQEDLLNAVNVFQGLLGGKSRYARFPVEIKSLIRGMRSDYLLRAFPTVGHMRAHLERFEWTDNVLPR